MSSFISLVLTSVTVLIILIFYKRVTTDYYLLKEDQELWYIFSPIFTAGFLLGRGTLNFKSYQWGSIPTERNWIIQHIYKEMEARFLYPISIQ